MTGRHLENFTIPSYDVKDQLKRHVYTRSMDAFARGDQARDAIVNMDQLKHRQMHMRQKLIQAIGGLPSMHTPLNPRMTGVVGCAGFRIEKIVFESRPSTFVTANMYIPEGIHAPRGTVLFLCGHNDQAKQIEEYQTVCQCLVLAGLVVLSVDPIGQGERLSYYEPAVNETTVRYGIIEHEYAGMQCWPLGDGLARYFLHDAMRAIDYLLTRPEVDADKIGVTGNSGGGTQTSLLMVCDPRIAAAAPATFIMNRETCMWSGQPQDAEQIWLGMTALGFDHEDILMAMVPRPVQVLAAAYDYFPIEGTRRTFDRTRRFWDMYGEVQNLEMYVDRSTHKYTHAMSKAAAAFFAKHLLASSPTDADVEITPLKPGLLWCTSSGQVRGDYRYARGVYEENIDRLDTLEKKRHQRLKENTLKHQALEWLQQKVFAARKIEELNPRYVPLGRMDELTLQSSIWWSQKDIINHAFIFKHFQNTGEELPITIAIWDKGTKQIQPHLEWIRQTCLSGRIVKVLDVTGSGALMPHPINTLDPMDMFGTIHKLSMDLFWLDDSLAALRTFDVIRALDAVAHLPDSHKENIEIFAYGRYSMYAQLAKTLDSRISRLETVCGIKSFGHCIRSRHYDAHDFAGLILPGMLNYFDLPDLEQW